MMRRGSKWNSNKKVDPNAPPPPVDPRSPPERPKELVKAQLELQDFVNKNVALEESVLVAPGFGFGDMSSPDRTSKWRLYVFIKEGVVKLPPDVLGFEVIRRDARAVPPVWGRAAR